VATVHLSTETDTGSRNIFVLSNFESHKTKLQCGASSSWSQ